MYRRGEVGQVARALRILDALRGFRQGRSLSELTTEVDVSERTVHRDLADLIDAGIRIDLTLIGNRAGAKLIDDDEHNHVGHVTIWIGDALILPTSWRRPESGFGERDLLPLAGGAP
jgi:HTH domain